MTIRLYNTLTQKVEDFVPLEPGKVKLYVCGITVYDLAHAGHGRTYTTFDVLVRFLRARGFEVLHCQNVTDVDDKIVNRAKERGEDPLALSKRMGELADEHLRAIGCLKPTMMPRVSTTIDGIVKITKTLIEKEHAYVSDTSSGASGGKDVYYSVRSFKDYAKLSRRNIDEMRAGASERLAENAEEVKKDPLDFALWKSQPKEAFGFDSPWGHGRPGWHIECSAMANENLGEQIDIHGGGMDLIFPHHENEVAQSEAANGKKFANYWMHGGFLEIDKEKMAKSLGNFVTIKDVLEKNDAEAYRYFILGTHYRGPLSFDVDKSDASGRVTFPGLDEAERRVDYLYTTRDALAVLAGDIEPGESNVLQGQQDVVLHAKEKVLEALDRDLNTPVALSVLADLGKAMNEIAMQAPKMKKDPAKHEAVRKLAALAVKSLKDATAPLGLMQATSEQYWARTKERRLRIRGLSAADIDAKIAERAEARKAKDFAKSDAIRKELADLGVEVFDAGDGSTWKVGI